MKRPISSRLAHVHSVLPTLFIALVFLGNTATILKSVLLAGAVVIFNGKRLGRLVDLNVILLVMFVFFYFFISKIDEIQKTEFSYPLLIMPVVLYVAGKWLGIWAKSSEGLAQSISLFCLLLGGISVLGLINNISNYGFEGGSRNLALSEDGLEMSATVLAGPLVGLVALGGLVFSRLSIVKKALVALVFLLAMFLALRLGSRTILTLGVASLFCGMVLNIKGQSFARILLSVFVFAVVVVVSYGRFSQEIEMFSYLQDRLNSDEYGAGTAGGRLDRWMGAMSLIPAHPFGWGIQVNGYSHNFWLDAARNGGWPSLILGVAVGASYLRSLRRALGHNRGDSIFTTMSICLTVCVLGIFFAEPILDGFLYVFGFFCCLWGVLSARGLICDMGAPNVQQG